MTTLTRPTKSQLFKAYAAARKSGKFDAQRLNRGLGIAQRKSTSHDGHALVVAGSKGETYKANGTCQCGDHTRRGVSWCKHRIGFALWVKAAQF